MTSNEIEWELLKTKKKKTREITEQIDFYEDQLMAIRKQLMLQMLDQLVLLVKVHWHSMIELKAKEMTEKKVMTNRSFPMTIANVHL